MDVMHRLIGAGNATAVEYDHDLALLSHASHVDARVAYTLPVPLALVVYCVRPYLYSPEYLHSRTSFRSKGRYQYCSLRPRSQG